eukprot:gnl/Trimastix_PCT/464.p1 GENE.gnl/Trimastix_PCT/464~~gnl/Trimastix_PCT/464.p1  ORF type:complete len:796 (+),score=266.56 gnl/Trimastix_PCT/464:30-2390(+)
MSEEKNSADCGTEKQHGTPPPWFETLPDDVIQSHTWFTEDEHLACLKVLKAVQDHPGLLNSARYRQLRRMGKVFQRLQQEKMAAQRAHNKQKRKSKQQEKRDHDRFLLRSRQLVQQREEAMQRKGMDLPAGPPALPAPDTLPLLDAPAEPRAGEAPAAADQFEAVDQSEAVVEDITEDALPVHPHDARLAWDGCAKAEEQTSEAGGVPAEGGDAGRTLLKPRACYICRERFTALHFFYERLCPKCAALNWRKRLQTADLRGKVAVCTGSRIKIGHQCALRLLKCGALVIATTRFPNDAALRFMRDPDFDTFKARLHIYGMDFRNLKSVGAFTAFVARHYDRLDVLVNNAAQTVRRPPRYYAHLMETEQLPFASLPPAAQQMRWRDPLYTAEAMDLVRQGLFCPDAWTGTPAAPYRALITGDSHAAYPSTQPADLAGSDATAGTMPAVHSDAVVLTTDPDASPACAAHFHPDGVPGRAEELGLIPSAESPAAIHTSAAQLPTTASQRGTGGKAGSGPQGGAVKQRFASPTPSAAAPRTEAETHTDGSSGSHAPAPAAPAAPTPTDVPVGPAGEAPGEAPGELVLLGSESNAAILSQVLLVPEDQLEDEAIFPSGKRDIDDQQIDMRSTNSWVKKIGEVTTVEVVEAHLVNTLAPYILCSDLQRVMQLRPDEPHYIINVSAMEGKFSRKHKTPNHPHTNMAKAALNMLTRTAAADLAKKNIFMNSVDTGWVTDERPFGEAAHEYTRGFQTPIDEVDAMGRVLDPVLTAYNTGTHHYGRFFKDYMPTDW